MGSYIGIDLGTTFSAVAVIDETGRPTIVHNEDGVNITPSVVTKKDNNTIEVGKFAKRQWGIDDTKAAARFKRNMGSSKKHFIGNQEFTPTELSTFVLKKLLKETKKSVGNISEAVVTIPANFSNEAREATMSAAKSAGLNVKFIINEPTAAALYYAFKSGEKLSGTYAVYDLGGGTFDISIIRVQGQDVDVLATNGLSRLGGDDFDTALQQIVSNKYKNETGEALQAGDYTKNDAEEDKKSLSKRDSIFTKIVRTGIDISRNEFEEAISKYIAQTEMICESTLDEAGIQPSDIQGVLLAGGSTRTPAIRKSVEKVFKQKPLDTINVDEIVALGAALYCAYKGDQSELTSVQKNALNKIKVKETTSKCFGILVMNYDNAKNQERLQNRVLINKGDKIPTSVSETFYTVKDGQENVKCSITESTTPETDPSFVKIIWEGDLKLPPGRKQGQKIKVSYAYDDNQIMKCSFIDEATGNENVVDLSLGASDQVDTTGIDKFLVE